MSLWLISEISWLFVNTMAADGKFSPPKRDNLTQPIQMQLSMTKNLFLKFLLHCWKIYEISNMFKKKMALMPNALPKLETANDVVRKMSKRFVSKHLSTVNMLKFSKHCWNLQQSTFTIFFNHPERYWVGKCLKS